jgi:cation diffusion facilitator family transporter
MASPSTLTPRLFLAMLRAPTEPQVLAFSIAATFTMAALGVVLGIVANSQAIIFDGIFAVIDASMTVLSFFVARLLQRDGSRRFQYGFWHFEPLVAAFNGSILLLLCLYAIVDAIRGVLAGGGQSVALDVTAAYSMIVCLICVVLYVFQMRANRTLRSALVAVDMQSFLMSACITIALFGGFGLAALIEHWGYPEMGRYADPLVLLLLALGLLPIPIRIVRDAMREVFLVAPPSVNSHVRRAVSLVVADHGLADFASYVAKSGRMYLVEIHILVPPTYHVSIDVYDAIRGEIADALGPAYNLRQWLSIAFTARREWI